MEGDVLYTAVGSYGHAATVPDDRQFTFQRHVALIRPKRSRVVPAFITAWLNSRLGRAAADRLAVGNAQLSVTLRDLKGMRMPLPQLAEQTQIVQLVETAKRMTHHADDSVNRCRVLKMGLLDDLLTGKVRVTPMKGGPEYALVEKPIIDYLGTLGYRYIHPNAHPALRARENEVLFRPHLVAALVRINGISEADAAAACSRTWPASTTTRSG